MSPVYAAREAQDEGEQHELECKTHHATARRNVRAGGLDDTHGADARKRY